jgi:hypothetical protein
MTWPKFCAGRPARHEFSNIRAIALRAALMGQNCPTVGLNAAGLSHLQCLLRLKNMQRLGLAGTRLAYENLKLLLLPEGIRQAKAKN